MSYFTRVLGTTDPDIHLDQIKAALASEGLTANFILEDRESAPVWMSLQVADQSGKTIITVERDPVSDGEELEEFLEEIAECEPRSAVKWLQKYLRRIKVIYAFGLLDSAKDESDHSILSVISRVIWSRTGGILQADNEGFSNEEGYHILWQFSDDVRGPWNMAVRTWTGEWKTFEMDLGNPDHRKAFKAGKIPK